MQRTHVSALVMAVAAAAATPAIAVDEAARLEAALRALPPVASWPLRDALFKALVAKQGPPPPGYHLYPMGEIYRGDRAVLVAVGVKGDLADPGFFFFHRDTAGWQFDGEAGGWAAAEKHVSEGQGEARILRRAGLPLESLPAHLRYLHGDWAASLRAAAEARDWTRWGALFEKGMAGVGLRAIGEALRIPEGPPAPADSVRLVRQEPLGARVRADFEVVVEGKASRQEYLLAREGAGWVIEGQYVPPVTQTVAGMRPLVMMLVLYANDHGGSFPAVREVSALAPLLTPAYGRELPPASDAWDTPFRYVAGADGKSFRLVSAGADKTFRPETWARTGGYADPAEDIVFDENGDVLRKWQPPQ